MRVNLLIIATNKYVDFVPSLLESVRIHFLRCNELIINIYTDRTHFNFRGHFGYSMNILIHKISHKPFPYATLLRYHYFKQHQFQMPAADYYFYIDADTLIKGSITSEILSERTATQHCGYVGKRGTYETRPESTSYVRPDEGERYYGGGFWGFSRKEFWKFIYKATEMIDADEAKGIIPVWHDESVLNRYLIDNPPTKVLTPSYHFPESISNRKTWKENYPCKILLLNKNHAEIRL